MSGGWTTYRVSSLNSARLVNIMQTQGIVLKNVLKLNTYLTFTIAGKSRVIAEKLLVEKNYEYTIIAQSDIKSNFQRMLKHIGAIVGAVCILAIICVGSMFCYDIEIDCKDIVSKHQIEAILKEDGAEKVFRKSKIDTAKTERKILQNCASVAFVGVAFHGGKLVVSVVMENKTQDLTTNYSKICASEDCIITRITVASGTALVKEGDRVIKGQELIAGYINLGNPDDPANVKQPVRADGKVFARVWRSERLNVSNSVVSSKFTGEREMARDISFFGWTISNKKTPSFANYKVEKSYKTIGTLFPIKITTYEYSEIAQEVKLLEQIDIDGIVAEQTIRLWNTLDEGARVSKTWNIQKRVDNLYIIDVYYELEQNVCVGEN